MSRAICWIRRELRLHDNAVLAKATKVANEVAVVFVYDSSALDRLGNRRVTFIHRSLEEIDLKLKAFGSRLIVRVGDPTIEIPRLADELKANWIFAGTDSDPEAIRQESAMPNLEGVKDSVIFERSDLLSGAEKPYTVFTPYSQAWLSRVTEVETSEHRPNLIRLMPLSGEFLPTLEQLGIRAAHLDIEAGEDAARRSLQQFLTRIDRYHELRDYPALDACSGLSVHFRFGTLSIREAFREALSRSTDGARKWTLELIWREFYQSILWHFPHVVHQAFHPSRNAIEWPGLEEHFDAWREGRTGFPLVDAAMRCLNATSKMHNRLRMVTASFLVKDLLIDWRRGESYFAQRLLDYDLASNNGGWQWCASTGCDAQPYFRVFNPVLQSRKYDPDGAFIREWVKELADLDNRTIHWPHDGLRRTDVNYPQPIVDHNVQRRLVQSLFKR
jgi:deoxyribodipyrimidine photo-lyase